MRMNKGFIDASSEQPMLKPIIDDIRSISEISETTSANIHDTDVHTSCFESSIIQGTFYCIE